MTPEGSPIGGMDEDMQPPKNLTDADIQKQEKWLRVKMLEAQYRVQQSVVVWNRWKVVGLIGSILSASIKFFWDVQHPALTIVLSVFGILLVFGMALASFRYQRKVS